MELLKAKARTCSFTVMKMDDALREVFSFLLADTPQFNKRNTHCYFNDAMPTSNAIILK